MTEKILRELNDIFVDVFDDKNIILTMETTADDIEDWDSLEQIHLIVAIEDRYGLKLSIRDVNALKDVGEMVNYIQERIT